jgi:hypothetical protein
MVYVHANQSYHTVFPQNSQSPQMELVDLVPLAKSVRVSSVLDRNTAEFGKERMFDGSPETCWSSAQGRPQYMLLSFASPVSIAELDIQFQGGFSAKRIDANISTDGKSFATATTFYPVDSNALQRFTFANNAANHVLHIQLLIPESSDLYGRITVYTLAIRGRQE